MKTTKNMWCILLMTVSSTSFVNYASVTCKEGLKITINNLTIKDQNAYYDDILLFLDFPVLEYYHHQDEWEQQIFESPK